MDAAAVTLASDQQNWYKGTRSFQLFRQLDGTAASTSFTWRGKDGGIELVPILPLMNGENTQSSVLFTPQLLEEN